MSQDENNQSDPSDDALARKTATAYHEAGHAVMACLVGRPIQNATITPANIQTGSVQTGGIRLGAVRMQKGRNKATKDWLEDDVMVLFAGMVAESQFTGQYCERGAKSDLSLIHI